MGSWVVAVVIVAGGASCLRVRAGRRLGGATGAGLVIAVSSYLTGAFEVLFADPARMCRPTVPIPDWNHYEEAFFPPTATCHWSDGRTVELVSPWVHPLLFTASGIAVVCLFALGASRCRRSARGRARARWAERV